MTWGTYTGTKQKEVIREKVGFLAILVALDFFAGTAQADRPKNYRINLSVVSSVGDAELRPGEYKLLVDIHALTVRFTDVNSGKHIEFEAQVENVEEKFDTTEIHSQNIDGTNRIVEIRIGGTKTKVAFKAD